MSAPGYAKVPNSVLQDQHLSDGAVRVYAVLLGLRADADGRVLATHEQLAQACGHSRKWAVDRIRELGDADLLEWTRGGKDRPNRYLLHAVVPARQERAERIVEIAPQPVTEPLDVARVLDAELPDHVRVAWAPATRNRTDGPAGLPHGARRDLAVGTLRHENDSRISSGEQGGDR